MNQIWFNNNLQNQNQNIRISHDAWNFQSTKPDNDKRSNWITRLTALHEYQHISSVLPPPPGLPGIQQIPQMFHPQFSTTFHTVQFH
jgi:hypothetical protein